MKNCTGLKREKKREKMPTTTKERVDSDKKINSLRYCLENKVKTQTPYKS